MNGRGAAVFEIEEGELLAGVPSSSTPLEGGGGAAAAGPGAAARLRARLPRWLGGAAGAGAFQRLASDDAPGADGADGADGDAAQPALRRPAGRWCPEEEASLASRLLFSYCGSLLALGAAKPLDHGDLWDLAERDAAATVSAAFAARLAATRRAAPAGPGCLWRAAWATHRGVFLRAGALKLAHDASMFAGPLLLEALLRHLEARGGRTGGLGLAAALAATAVAQTLLINGAL
jgi:hypothetical protein